MTGKIYTYDNRPARVAILLLAALLLLAAPSWAMHGNAAIDGITGPSFSLTAKDGYIRTGDGGSVYIWGYADGFGDVQYPGPTLIVNQGDTVTIMLTSRLPQATSIVIPGFEVTATGGVPGILTQEAPPDQVTTVSYAFVADRPGTFMYSSGTNADFQVEMGLVGAIIVRPTGFDATIAASRTAYGSTSSQYDQEYLFLLTDMDPRVHELAESGRYDEITTTEFHPVYWFINGRTGPDTMLPAHVPWLPTQPYNCFPFMNVRDRLLLRVIGGGRDAHPYHTHGNNFDQIARDGWLLESTPAATRSAEVGEIPDVAISDFTLNTFPGATYDAIFTWTANGLGWDMYGPIDSTCTDADNDGLDDTAGTVCHDATPIDVAPADGIDDVFKEPIADHGKPFPTVLPFQGDLAFGAFYSGSPYLGAAGSLPPGEGGNNPNSGFAYMWHSHNEKELTNNDIFPGGMMTMMIVESPLTGN